MGGCVGWVGWGVCVCDYIYIYIYIHVICSIRDYIIFLNAKQQ